MAVTNLDELLIELRADNRQLLAALNQSTNATNQFAQQAQRSGSKASSAFNALSSTVMRFAGPAVIGYAVKQLIDFGVAAMQTADAISDTAKQLGLSTDAYQGLAYAAQQSGVEVATFHGAMRRLLVTAGDAVEGNDAAREAFTNLGISIQEVASLSPEQLFSRVAESVSSLSTAQEKAAKSADIFGKEGTKLVTLLSGGADEITRLREEAEKLGVVIDDDLIERSAEMNDQWEAAKKVINANATALMLELAPAIVAVTKALGTGAGAVNHFFDQFKKVENISDAGLSSELERINEQLKLQYEVLERIGTANKRAERLQGLIKENEERKIAIERELEIERIKDRAAKGIRTAGGPGRKPVVVGESDSERKAREKEESNSEGTSTSQWIRDKDAYDEGIKRQYESELEQARSIEEGISETSKNNLSGIEEFADGIGRTFDDLFETNQTSTERMLEDWANMAEQMDIVWGDTIGGAAKALTDFLFTGEADFESFAKSVIQNLIEIQIQKALAGMLGSAGGGWGAIGTAIGGAFGLGKAGGGAVQQGVAVPVGERGPEIFVPSSAGRIVPNHALGQMGGQTSVTVEVVNKGTPQKSTGAQASQTPKGLVVQIMTEDLQTGGPMSKGFQSAFNLKRNS